MADERRIERRQSEIEELAEGWGKLLALEMFPDGVGLDVDLFAREEFAVTAAKSLVRGPVETMTGDQAESLGPSTPVQAAASGVSSTTAHARSRFAAAPPTWTNRWLTARRAVEI